MRILIIHRELPFPADNGGRLRAACMARYLATHHDTALVCFSATSNVEFPEQEMFRYVKQIPIPPCAPALRRIWSRLPSEVADLDSAEMAAAIERIVSLHDPQVILVSEPALTPYLRPYGDRVRVLDYLMVTTLSLQRLGEISSGWKQWLWRARWRKAAALHREIASFFDLCLVNSKEDYDDLLKTSSGWQWLEFFPNGLILEEYPVGLAVPDASTLIYPGSVTYAPNRDAVAYMIDRILPLIRETVPDVKLLVTGAIANDGSAPQSPGVVYTGRVEDVRPVIASAWVCVVPLRSGAGGTRFKLLESMALGTPLVSTRIGAEGIDWTDGTDILIADEPEAFAARTIELLRSPDYRQSLSAAGRQLMQRQYDWNVLGGRVTEMLEHILAAKRSSISA
jgi:polysaccharide biosynthesis protein PslH